MQLIHGQEENHLPNYYLLESHSLWVNESHITCDGKADSQRFFFHKERELLGLTGVWLPLTPASIKKALPNNGEKIHLDTNFWTFRNSIFK